MGRTQQILSSFLGIGGQFRKTSLSWNVLFQTAAAIFSQKKLVTTDAKAVQ
jgi:hypothetical protein